MILSQISDTAIIELTGVVLTIAGGAAGSFLAVKIALATLTAQYNSLREWLEGVAKGERKIDGQMQEQITANHVVLTDLAQRVGRIELACARRSHCEEAD